MDHRVNQASLHKVDLHQTCTEAHHRHTNTLPTVLLFLMVNNNNGEWECRHHIYSLKPVPVQITIRELLSMDILKLANQLHIHSRSIKEAMPLQTSMHKPMFHISKQANQAVLNQQKTAQLSNNSNRCQILCRSLEKLVMFSNNSTSCHWPGI